MSRHGSRGGEGGAAFAFTVLLMMALLVLAHGALLGSLSELAGSRAAARDLRRRGAAQHALSALLRGPPAAWSQELGTWDERVVPSGTVGGFETEGRARRLGPESWLVEGIARDGRGPLARTARLAWAPDPLERILALPGAVTVAPGAPTLLAGSVDASSPDAVLPPLRPEDCDPWLDGLRARFRITTLPVVASAPDSVASLSLGLLDFDALSARVVVGTAGSGTPEPVEVMGACVEDEPWNWGDPDRPWRPCGPHLPIRAAPGDLLVLGGVGQAVLVVDGDLTFDEGARIHGLAIVRGTLTLQGSATFEGMALASGGLSVGPGSTFRASACWAVRTLAGQRELLGSPVLVTDARMGPL